ncbi:MAG: 2-oxoacid:acceptor oxidoreductase family protein, partial [Candidatus Heimdallarchaeota archaeon]
KKIPKKIKEKTILAPMIAIAEEAGNMKATNMVLLGILNQLFDLASPKAFIQAIKSLTAARFHDVNIKAFKKGSALDLNKYNSEDILLLADICRIKE